MPVTAACTAGGYDARANLICDGRHFTYDVENRLLTGTTLPGANITLDYDPEGHLVSYTSGSTVTTFQYDGSDLIAEYGSTSSSATPLRRYVHGSGTDDPEIWFEGSGNSDIRYVYANYQGSVIATSNTAGTNLVTYKYDPYGVPKDAGNNDSWSGFRFRYTGQTMLGEAHLYYYKARVYDPATGHFLQTDPIGSKDDLDLYAYVSGDPINHTDPTGNAVCGFICHLFGGEVQVNYGGRAHGYYNHGAVNTGATVAAGIYATGAAGTGAAVGCAEGCPIAGLILRNAASSPKTALAGMSVVQAVNGALNGENAAEASALSASAQVETKGLTVAGRAVTKHPGYFGYETTEALQKANPGNASLNKLGQGLVDDALQNGTRTTGAGGRYPDGWITYTLPDGRAASWTADGDFIGFRGLK